LFRKCFELTGDPPWHEGTRYDSRNARPAPPACGLDWPPLVRLFRLQVMMPSCERDCSSRAEGTIERTGPTITSQSLKTFAGLARKRMRTESGGYRRDHLRALAQRVEVDSKEVRIMGSKSELLRTFVVASSAKTAGFNLPSFVPKWRARRDSNS
jgi:hypothetical protein